SRGDELVALALDVPQPEVGLDALLEVDRHARRRVALMLAVGRRVEQRHGAPDRPQREGTALAEGGGEVVVSRLALRDLGEEGVEPRVVAAKLTEVDLAGPAV